VGLEAILLEMPPSVAEVTNVDECTILNFVPLAFAPEALVTQPVICPIPWTVDGLLNATDALRAKGRCGGGEGVGDMAVETAVSIHAREAACGFIEGEVVISQLLSHVCNLTCTMNNLCACRPMADDFCTQRVIAFLAHSPVDTFQVCLVVGEEELLIVVKSGMREFVGAGVEVFGVDRTASSSRP